MTRADLKNAVSEAKRFLERAQRLQKAQPDKGYYSEHFDGSRESGAVHRASMDLTRALSTLRDPRRRNAND